MTQVVQHEHADRTRPRVARFRAVRAAVAAVAFAYAIVWTMSYPGAPMLGFGLIGIAFLVMFNVWSVQAWRPLAGTARTAALIVSLTVIAAAIVGSIAGLPVRARFALSATEFNALAATLPPAAAVEGDYAQVKTPEWCPTQVGAYVVRDCHIYGGAYVFLQPVDAISDDAGFAYLPQGVGPDLGYDSGFRHLSGPWYTWRLEPMTP